MARAGGFDHNAHTLRLLTRLESPYPRHRGLNLSWETLEGLAKHNGPVAQPSWALAEANSEFPLDLGTWPSLEAQIAAIADDIAYDNHDVDDGLRAGLFTLEDLCAVPMVARSWTAVRARYPDLDEARLLPELVRDQIGLHGERCPRRDPQQRLAGARRRNRRRHPARRTQPGRLFRSDGDRRAPAQRIPLRENVPVRADPGDPGQRPSRCSPACSKLIGPSRICCLSRGGRPSADSTARAYGASAISSPA